MLLSHKDDHDGWTIQTECREDNPEDWKPGDPIRYSAWGTATFRRDYLYPGKWHSTAEQRVAPAHFDDFNKAHREIRAELISKIDGLKEPT